MNSRAGAQVSLPTWGARRRRDGAPARRALAARLRLRPRRALVLRGPRAFPSEIVAAAVLVVAWVLLWSVFAAGIVSPAASLLP